MTEKKTIQRSVYLFFKHNQTIQRLIIQVLVFSLSKGKIKLIMASGGSDRLTNEDIISLAEAIAAKHMEGIAMRYFHID